MAEQKSVQCEMTVDARQVRAHRLRAHHLDAKYPTEQLLAAAGVCGLQNSPPGAWETAMFNRLSGCRLPELRAALYSEKRLLQAWSYRGVPVVFPAQESDIFLSPLLAQPGEEPWIYTRGITAALEYVRLPFDDVLARVQRAAAYLDTHTVQSKEALDDALARLVAQELPPETRARWNAPSIYGAPDRQTVGGAAVSFLLRPCSFASLVVFGEREGASPAFTSFRRWLGREPSTRPDAEKQLVRKFLHCYGPSTRAHFADWLGCSPRQAQRLWACAADEMAAVRLEGQTRWLLRSDLGSFSEKAPAAEGGRLLLLGAHDPYLDLRDRALILPDAALQRRVWRTVANPGAVLCGGSVAGIWQARAGKGRLDVTITLWQEPSAHRQRTLCELAAEHASFRMLSLGKCTVQTP